MRLSNTYECSSGWRWRIALRTSLVPRHKYRFLLANSFLSRCLASCRATNLTARDWVSNATEIWACSKSESVQHKVLKPVSKMKLDQGPERISAYIGLVESGTPNRLAALALAFFRNHSKDDMQGRAPSWAWMNWQWLPYVLGSGARRAAL